MSIVIIQDLKRDIGKKINFNCFKNINITRTKKISNCH